MDFRRRYHGRDLAETYAFVQETLQRLFVVHKGDLQRLKIFIDLEGASLSLSKWHQDNVSISRKSLNDIWEPDDEEQILKFLIACQEATQKIFELLENVPLETEDAQGHQTDIHKSHVRNITEKVTTIKRNVAYLRQAEWNPAYKVWSFPPDTGHETDVPVDVARRSGPSRATGPTYNQVNDSYVSSDASKRFRDIADDMRTRLRAFLRRRKEWTKSFFPRSTAKTVFRTYRKDIKDLYLHGSSDPEKKTRVDHFVQTVIGSCRTETDSRDETGADEGLSDLLAMLIFPPNGPSKRAWECFETLCLKKNNEAAKMFFDSKLPLKDEHLRQQFEEEDAQQIWQNQFQFCPIVFLKNKLVEAQELQRSPYVEEESYLGSGSFGTVFRVKIEVGHLVSRDSMNRIPLRLARKDFMSTARAGEAWTTESKIALDFLQKSVLRHNHIMQVKASLRQGEKLSLFFELAECDLAKYMAHSYGSSRSNPPSPGSAPSTLQEKTRIFNQGLQLASALEYLHNGVQIPGSPRITCYHLDLKPENILVVDDETLGETFKITDFSISRTHAIGGKPEEKMDYSRMFHRVVHREEMSGSSLDVKTRNVGGDSTFISPEGKCELRQVSASNDVWAFGCLMCIILVWLHGGWTSLASFSKERSDANEGDDYFFTYRNSSGTATSSTNHVGDVNQRGIITQKEFILNPAVQKRFEGSSGILKTTRDATETLMYTETWHLIREKLLVRNHERRIRMGLAFESLRDISQKLHV